jgi:hypothetical protein
MAIVSVKEKFDRRSTRKRKDGSNTITTHTRVWIVECSDIRDGTAEAAEAAGVPQIGEAHPQSFGCECTSVDADPLDRDSHRFEVTAEYSDEADAGGSDRELPPLDRPWDISWGGTASTGPYFIDTEDKPVVNSAGEAFDSFLERETSELTITITKNHDRGDPGTDELYSNTTNDNDVQIAGTVFLSGTLKLSPIQASHVTETSGGYTISYWRKTFQMKARRDGWTERLEDRGYNERIPEQIDHDGDSTTIYKMRPILDTNAQNARKPQLLDGDGKLLAIDAPPVELEFKPYQPLGWAGLGFTA